MNSHFHSKGKELRKPKAELGFASLRISPFSKTIPFTVIIIIHSIPDAIFNLLKYRAKNVIPHAKPRKFIFQSNESQEKWFIERESAREIGEISVFFFVGFFKHC